MSDRIMLCGDWHGDAMHGVSCILQAKKRDIKEIFVLGDFGYWPRERTLNKFVPKLQKECEQAGVDIFWIDGNHEDFDSIALFENLSDEFAYVTKNITYIKRGTSLKIGNTLFATCGGAYSIDRSWRTLGVSYFDQELTTLAQAYLTIENGKGADVLLSHDAPTMSPVTDEWKKDQYTEGNRALIQGIIDELKPSYNFHGHYHEAYTHVENGTTVIGLARNEMFQSRGIFNVITKEWEGYIA